MLENNLVIKINVNTFKLEVTSNLDDALFLKNSLTTLEDLKQALIYNTNSNKVTESIFVLVSENTILNCYNNYKAVNFEYVNKSKQNYVIYLEKTMEKNIVLFRMSKRTGQREVDYYDYLTKALTNESFERNFILMLGERAIGVYLTINIDDFANINLHHGHMAGDNVLKKTVDTLKKYMPNGSIIGRKDGDEFRVYLANTNKKQAEIFIKNFLDDISSNKLNNIDISYSIGAVTVRKDFDFNNIIMNGNLALHDIKKSGKNAFLFYEDINNKKVKSIKEIIDDNTSVFNYRLILKVVIIIVLFIAVEVTIVNSATHYQNNYRDERIDEIKKAQVQKIETFNDNVKGVLNVFYSSLDYQSFDYGDINSFENYIDSITTPYINSRVGFIDENMVWHEKGVDKMYYFYISDIYKHENEEFYYINNPDINKDNQMVFLTSSDYSLDDGTNILATYIYLDDETMTEALVKKPLGVNIESYCCNDFGEILFSANQSIFSTNISSELENAEFTKGTYDEFINDENSEDYYVVTIDKKLYVVVKTSYDGTFVVNIFLYDSPVLSGSTIINNTLMFSRIFLLAVGLLFIMYYLITLINKKRLQDIAYIDPVTKHINKMKFEEHSKKLLSKQFNKYAMVYMRANHYEIVLSRIGESDINKVLRKISDTVDQNFRNQECFTRISGGLFCLLIEANNNEEIESRIKQIENSVVNTDEVLGIEFSVSFNYGTYLCGTLLNNFNEYYEYLSIALDKTNNQERIKSYNEIMRDSFYSYKEIESKMQSALDNGEFKIYYQPKVDIYYNTVVGAEALIRWEKDGEIISPKDFIPIFEKNGFIIKLDIFAFRKTCEFIEELSEKYGVMIPISINVSRSHMNNRNFLKDYIDIWKEYHIPSEMIMLEITESMFNDDYEFISSIISLAHEVGFKISMDDFGTGYSSFHMLQSLEIDNIKIDKALIILDGDYHKKEIVLAGIIDMAYKLGMGIICEGVETSEQINLLKKYNCRYVQGYYYSKPINKKEFVEYATHEKNSTISDDN